MIPEATTEYEEEVNLIKGIEEELNATIMNKLSESSTVSWRMDQEATNTDQTVSKVKDILQEGSQLDNWLLLDKTMQYTRYLDEDAYQGCSQMWKRAETCFLARHPRGYSCKRSLMCNMQRNWTIPAKTTPIH